MFDDVTADNDVSWDRGRLFVVEFPLETKSPSVSGIWSDVSRIKPNPDDSRPWTIDKPADEVAFPTSYFDDCRVANALVEKVINPIIDVCVKFAGIDLGVVVARVVSHQREVECA